MSEVNLFNYKDNEVCMKNKKRVLGLDIGAASIGYSLLDIGCDVNGKTVFKDIVSNSIIFSANDTAEERREARSARKLHKRKSTRKKAIRRLYVQFNFADESFVLEPTEYLQSVKTSSSDVYNIREKALAQELSKKDFLLATYSILTKRGYSNMFEPILSDEAKTKEDGKANASISSNKFIYQSNPEEYLIPSQILTEQRSELQNTIQNLPIRNKLGNYTNSLDRELHEEEFRKVVLSQENNKLLFETSIQCHDFIEKVIAVAFFQNELQSFEDMVAYCGFYNKYHLNAKKRCPVSNFETIELTIRQAIDNYSIINTKTGEIKRAQELLTTDDIEKIVNFWTTTSSSEKITSGNIYTKFNSKLKIHTEKEFDIVKKTSVYKKTMELISQHKLDYKDSQNEEYRKLLEVLSYHKNKPKRIIEIKNISDFFTDEIAEDFASLTNIDGFSSFSYEYTAELLEKMRSGLSHSDALSATGFNSKYLNMPTYDYLPPLNPTKADIEYLVNKLPYFKEEHLFYMPLVSPTVKQIIGIMRKLINKIIKEYGVIDEIRIESAGDSLNSKKEIKKMNDAQLENNKKNKAAKEYLVQHQRNSESPRNIERVRLFLEQKMKCLYSGQYMNIDEVLDERITEVEHFIPRSHIWVNAQKNKILVYKKYNQNKSKINPMIYLKSDGRWEGFVRDVEAMKTEQNKSKVKWLTNEESINAVYAKDSSEWKSSYLNDTRSAIKTIRNYLNHYLFPKEKEYNKGGNVHISSISGRAISELKYIWGVSKLIANKDCKKDRNTNYHHTIDAFIIALCDNSAANELHKHIRRAEDKWRVFKEEKNENNIPKSINSIGLNQYLSGMVSDYKENKRYVCPLGKRKRVRKGFEDGNKKLIIKDDSLFELDKISLAPFDMLNIKKGVIVSKRTEEQILNYKQELFSLPIQQNIKEGLERYIEELLESKKQIESLEKEIKTQEAKIKKDEKSKIKDVENERQKALVVYLKEQNRILTVQQNSLYCYFLTKKGLKQRVNYVRKISSKKTGANAILIKESNGTTIKRLDTEILKEAKTRKVPFVCKKNGGTLNISLYAGGCTGGQAVGINYFSSLKNNIPPNFNSNNSTLNLTNKKPELKIFGGDVLKVYNNGEIIYVKSAGGGDVSGAHNTIEVDIINSRKTKREYVTLNKKTQISLVKIDFFGR